MKLKEFRNLRRTAGSSSSSRRSKNIGIVAYVLIACGLGWAIFCFLWLLPIPESSSVYQLSSYFFAFSLAISAIIVRVLITHEGFADAGLKPKLISKWHYYLLSVLWPFVIIAGIVALMLTLGLLSPNLRLTEDARSVITDVAAWIPLVFSALLFTPVMWGEEFGWRSYLQIRLFNNYKPLVAAIITGLIWGVWHFPALIPGSLHNQNGVLSMLGYYVYHFSITNKVAWISYWLSC